MLNYTTIPTNPEILKQDGGLINKYTVIIALSVMYQFVTEIGFFYSMLSANISHFFAGKFVAGLLALIFTSIVEGIGIASLVYCVESYLDKRHGFNMRFCIPFATMFICYTVSATISYHGVPAISEKIISTPTLSNTQSIDSVLTNERQLILSNYSNDSLLTARNYNNVITGIQLEYKSKIDFQKNKLEKHKRDKKKGVKWAQSWIDKRKGNIINLESERNTKVLEQKQNKRDALATLLATKNKDLKSIKGNHTTEKNKIENHNTTLTKRYSERLSSSDSLGRFGVFFTLAIIILGTTYTLNSKYEAGVKSTKQINVYFFEDSIVNKFMHLLNLKVNNFFHHRLDRSIERNTRTPKKPNLKENIIYEKRDITKYVDPFQLDETQQNLDDIKASFPVMERKDDTRKNGDDTQRKKAAYDFRMDDLNGDDTRKDDTTKGRRDDTLLERGTILKEKLRKCEHCGSEYIYNHKKQRFCSTDCRKAAWKKKTGRDPMMKKRKG